MTHTCPNCNNNNDENDVYCSNCGYNLKLMNLSAFSNTAPLSQDLLLQYQQIEDQISDLEGIEDQVKQAYDYHQTLLKESKKLEDILSKRRLESAKEFKDVDELKKITWTSIKSRVSGKRDELLSKEEKEYFEAVNNEETAKKDFNEIMKRVNTAKKQLTEVQQLANRRLDLERDLVALLDKIYRGEAGDQNENMLETEVQRIEDRKVPITTELNRLEVAGGHLINAKVHFNDGLERLGSAKGFSNWDTFMGGGFFVDSMKHSRVADARNSVQQGHYALERAYGVYPQLPRINRPNIQETSYFWDTIFDNFWSDMQAREKIQESYQSVQYTLMDINSAVNWVNNRKNDFENQLRSVEKDLITKKRELSSYRRTLIVKAIKNKKIK
ncbi:MAG: hypothetical protein ACFFD1_13380 [Candidatus Thorarchaeota archaeon]